ncbi:TPA: hypothetical protein ACGO3A_002139 [Streptococcus suis]
MYYAPGTCALACWIALEWAGADYEVVKVKLGSPEYLKVNPLGRYRLWMCRITASSLKPVQSYSILQSFILLVIWGRSGSRSSVSVQ